MKRMRLPYLLVGLATFFGVGARASAESCTYETQVKPLCEKIRAADKAGEPIVIGQSKLPTSAELASQVANFNARKKKLTKAEAEKFLKVATKAKEYSEKVLLNGRTESELSGAEKNLIARIRSMNFSNLESEHDQTICQDEGYLGWAPQTNSIVICPVLGGLSETALIQATAMFIGRGLGSCMTSLPKPATKHEPIASDKNPFDLKCDMRSCEQGGLRTCLVDGSDGKITGPMAPDYTTPHALDSMAKVAKQHKKELGDIEKLIGSSVKTYPTCFPAITADKSDSAAGEWFGAEVVSAYLEANPSERDLEPAGTLAWFIDDACRYHERKDISKLYGHADHETRFNKVLARNPRFRKQLNCERAPTAAVDCALSLKKTPEPAAGVSSSAGAAVAQ